MQLPVLDRLFPNFFCLYLVGGLTGSAIVGNDVSYLTYLSTLLKPVSSKSSRWRRCWRASVDGWAASTFHGRCDHKGPTVTIIRVGGKYIFGGYTSVSWGKWKYFLNLSVIACKIAQGRICNAHFFIFFFCNRITFVTAYHQTFVNY